MSAYLKLAASIEYKLEFGSGFGLAQGKMDERADNGTNEIT